uniref:F-box domain-containing protein n=1 Tax=Biomphalaria glabrata TaxID=6526 RepID=A0A2C9M4M1_BIOGL
MDLEDMPEEIIIYIASFLTDQDKSNLARTCRNLKRISYTKSLWEDSVVYLQLTENTDGYEIMYTSLEKRGLSLFNIDNYRSLAAHLLVIAQYWPSLICIHDFSQNEAQTGFMNITNKVMKNVRTLSLFRIDTKFTTLILSLFPFLTELDLNTTHFSDDCLSLLVSSLIPLQILRISRTDITNQGVAFMCGSKIQDQTIMYDATASKLQTLEVLDISRCRHVSPQIWQCLSKLEKLNTVYLSSGPDVADDDEYKDLALIPTLKCIFMRDISDPERVITQIAESGCILEGLCLDGEIDDTSTLNFREGFPDLLYLKLNSQILTDCGLANMAFFLSRLIVIDLSGCSTISQHGIKYLAKRMDQLKFIRILNCPAISTDIVSSMTERICIHLDSLKKRKPDLSMLQNDHQRSIWLRQILCSY